MERTFIQMPIMSQANPNYSFDGFRARFFEITGMKIPSTCSKNEQETHYLTGELKTHLTEDVKAILKTEFPMVKFTDGFPDTWVSKTVEI